MGIRFLCPNGHRLNVKQELAGKRGVCPDCDARFEIPAESTIPSRREQAADPAPSVAEQPVEVPASEAIAPSAVVAPPPAEVVWYVELPSGERLGPADPDTMRGWLEEGRVVADSLVWRTGWEEWQAGEAAERAFNLAVTAAPETEKPSKVEPSAETTDAQASASVAEASDASAVIPVEEPSIATPAAAVVSRRQQQKQRRKQATVLLTAVVLVLGLVLVVVLSL